MKTAAIKITRRPYEEPDCLNLWINASNGHIRGTLEYYCNTKDLETVGKKLIRYVGEQNESVIYELGSEEPMRCGFYLSLKSSFFLSLKIMPLDLAGHSVICLRLNNNRQPPDTEVSEFCLRADVADINRLGSLLVGFGKLDHHVLYWSVREGKLFKNEEDFERFAQEA